MCLANFMGKSHHWAMKALKVVAVALKSILCVVFDVVGDMRNTWVVLCYLLEAYSLDLQHKDVAEANKRGIIWGCLCKRKAYKAY